MPSRQDIVLLPAAWDLFAKQVQQALRASLPRIISKQDLPRGKKGYLPVRDI